MERITEIEPAYDKRSDDPKKNYGVHGMTMRYVLKEQNRAVQFVIYTNWHLPSVKNMCKPSFCLNKPMAADLGYHSPKPIYEDQEIIDKNCKYVGGPCYYDGSGLNAERVFQMMVEKGGEAMWKELEDYYKGVFGKAETKYTGFGSMINELKQVIK